MTLPLRVACVMGAVGLGAPGFLPCTPQETPPRAPAGLAIEVRGHGPDIVLVHGALGDYRQWRTIATTLSGDHRVVAISRRFHWPNLPPTGSIHYTYEGHSADLEELLRALGRPAHLVGHSYGAGVALLTALRHPELVLSLTLIEPPFSSLVPPTAPELAGELASRDSMVAAIRASVRAGEAERAAEVLIDWVQGGAGGFRRLSPAARKELRANAATVGATYAAPAPEVTCEQLRALSLPVFILRGERTRPWYRLIATAAAACLPNAEAAVVPAAAHMTIVENPRDTARLVADFLARRDPDRTLPGPPRDSNSSRPRGSKMSDGRVRAAGTPIVFPETRSPEAPPRPEAKP